MKLKGKKKILAQTSNAVYNVPRKTVQQQHPQKIKYFTRRTITGMCFVRQKEAKKDKT